MTYHSLPLAHVNFPGLRWNRSPYSLQEDKRMTFNILARGLTQPELLDVIRWVCASSWGRKTCLHECCDSMLHIFCMHTR